MATDRERIQDDLDFDPSYDEIDVDELLAAVHEDHLYEPPRRARRERSAWRRIESRRERRWLKKQLSDWESEDDDQDDFDEYDDRY